MTAMLKDGKLPVYVRGLDTDYFNELLACLGERPPVMGKPEVIFIRRIAGAGIFTYTTGTLRYAEENYPRVYTPEELLRLHRG